MFEPGCCGALAPLLCAPPAPPLAPGTPVPFELDDPRVVPGADEVCVFELEPAGPIALPGIAGPASPGYITVAPMPVMISGRCSWAPFRYPIPHAHRLNRRKPTTGVVRDMVGPRCKFGAGVGEPSSHAELQRQLRESCRRAAQPV